MSSKVKSFEDLVGAQLSFGKYEKTVIFMLGFIFIADGIEVSALSLILPLLREEWEISENLQGLMGTMLFLGLFLGSLLAGVFTDRLGRRRAVLYVSLLQFVLGLYSALVHNVYLFILVRGLFGFLLGFIVPLVPTLCAELIPIEIRGKITVIVNSLFSVGQFIATLIAYFCLNNLGSGNWRLLLMFCSFPSLIVWYLCYKYMLESPRYIMLKMDIENGIDILNKMVIFNTEKTKKPSLFSMEEHGMEFRKWAEHVNSFHQHDHERHYLISFVSSLFKDKYIRITLCMWLAWFGINFVFYGLVFILPFFLSEWDKMNQIHHTAEHGILNLLITTAGEGASGILAYFMVETETFGRKYSLALGQVISAIACFIAYFISMDNGVILIGLLTVGRFFGKMCFAVIYPLTAEIYPTILRTKGIGAASAVGRLASCIMPIITIKIFYLNVYAPFLLLCAFGILGLVGTMFLEKDTRGRHLDMHEEINIKTKEYDEDDPLSACQI